MPSQSACFIRSVLPAHPLGRFQLPVLSIATHDCSLRRRRQRAGRVLPRQEQARRRHHCRRREGTSSHSHRCCRSLPSVEPSGVAVHPLLFSHPLCLPFVRRVRWRLRLQSNHLSVHLPLLICRSSLCGFVVAQEHTRSQSMSQAADHRRQASFTTAGDSASGSHQVFCCRAWRFQCSLSRFVSALCGSCNSACSSLRTRSGPAGSTTSSSRCPARGRTQGTQLLLHHELRWLVH